ncbi:MAG: tRNA lysidine(34) synthetase TilS [Rhodoferax sp.]|nr:tRNA lysidine(34) synthetase TilS [Rhodoferax sp.]
MTQSLEQAMQAFHPQLPLGVAYSGGADSTTLLVQCARRWPGQVVALHINHGLQAAAMDFEAHCQRTCTAFNVPLRVQAVQAFHSPGQSPEDAARIARYQGLLALAEGGEQQPRLPSIALAQHADDQIETLLLALSRGAGIAGLSAMPMSWNRAGIAFHRPLLHVASATIRNWIADERIACIHDPSNTDERFTRNRIRACVMPALQTAFPQLLDTWSRSAAHAAQAQSLLDEIAGEDLDQMLRMHDHLPLIKALQTLNPQRQANALRHWLKTAYGVIPSTAQLHELQRQIQACTTRGHRLHIKVGAGFVKRRGQVLDWYNPAVLPD